MVLKKKLREASVLAFPDGTVDFVIYSDALAKGLGCILIQCIMVISYASQQLKEAKMRYATHHLYLAAIAFSLTI